MKGKTVKISITINENTLIDIDEYSDILDVSRSKLISRYAKDGLKKEFKTDFKKIIKKFNEKN